MVNLTKEQVMKKIDLNKKKVEKIVEDRNITTKARVVIVLDKSGSTSLYYTDGTIRNLLHDVLPFALTFDDNGELEVWVFSTGFKRLTPVVLNNCYDYTEEVLMREYPQYGGTEYTPVLKNVYNECIVKDHSPIPTYVIFITDGENGEGYDNKDFKRFMQMASEDNIFFKLFGVGNGDFSLLSEMHRLYKNVSFTRVNDFGELNDDRLYHILLDRFPMWSGCYIPRPPVGGLFRRIWLYIKSLFSGGDE